MLNALKKMFGFAPIEPVRVEAVPAPVVEAVNGIILDTLPQPAPVEPVAAVVEPVAAVVEPVAAVVETAGTPVVAEVKKARRVPATQKKPRASRKAV